MCSQTDQLRIWTDAYNKTQTELKMYRRRLYVLRTRHEMPEVEIVVCVKFLCRQFVKKFKYRRRFKAVDENGFVIVVRSVKQSEKTRIKLFDKQFKVLSLRWIHGQSGMGNAILLPQWNPVLHPLGGTICDPLFGFVASILEEQCNNDASLSRRCVFLRCALRKFIPATFAPIHS